MTQSKSIKPNNTLLHNEIWIQKLWAWADKNRVPNLELVEEHGGYWVGLPRDKQRLLKLTCLRLNANNISELPREIGNLTKLKELSLYKNKLTCLPEEIGSLEELTRLWLGDNGLLSLPEEIGSLSCLTTLNLKNNNLTSLPRGIINLTKLTKIWLGGNPRLNWTEEQIEWICDLKACGCTLEVDSYLLRLLAEVEEGGSRRTLCLPGEYDHSRKRLESGADESDESQINLWTNEPEKWGAPDLAKIEDDGRVCDTLTSEPDEEEHEIVYEVASLLDADLIDKERDEDANWPQRIWEWADRSSIPHAHIPRQKEALAALTTLDLRNRALTSLPHEIGNLINLKELSLLGNNLRVLPSEIGNLINLTWLGLANNYLTELPAEIVNIGRLTFLRLAENHDLVLTEGQKRWIGRLKSDGCRVSVDDDLFEREE